MLKGFYASNVRVVRVVDDHFVDGNRRFAQINDYRDGVFEIRGRIAVR